MNMTSSPSPRKPSFKGPPEYETPIINAAKAHIRIARPLMTNTTSPIKAAISIKAATAHSNCFGVASQDVR